MLLLDVLRKPKQAEPAFENHSPYMSKWNSYNDNSNINNKQDSFIHVPLSPPMSRYARYNRYKNYMTDMENYGNEVSLSASSKQLMTNKEEIGCRMLCCCCFPCLPLWGRTLCCLGFLGICVFLVTFILIVSTFKTPQALLVENTYEQQNGIYNAKYSLQNDNFFGFDFENIKVMAYYSGMIETVGVGEVAKLELQAKSIVNITVPMQIMIHGQSTEDSLNKTEPFLYACSSNHSDNVYRRKYIEVSFDIMPTIKMLNYPVATVVFHGQKTKITCDNILKNTSFIDNVL